MVILHRKDQIKVWETITTVGIPTRVALFGAIPLHQDYFMRTAILTSMKRALIMEEVGKEGWQTMQSKESLQVPNQHLREKVKRGKQSFQSNKSFSLSTLIT